MRRKIIEGIEPMNDLRAGCHEHAIYPIIKYMGNDLNDFLLNTFFCYDFSKPKLMGKEITYDIFEALGYRYEIKKDGNDIINYLKGEIDNMRPALVGCDYYELPEFKTVYQVVHGGHGICVYGYDDDNSEFHILDHKYHDTFLYIKQTIKYEELRKAVLSCGEYLGYIHIATIHKDNNISVSDTFSFYRKNFAKYNNEIRNSFQHIKNFADMLYEHLDSDYTSLPLGEIGHQFTLIMNRKYFELGVINMLFNDTRLSELATQRVSDIAFISAVITKYQYSDQLKRDSFIKMIDKAYSLYEKEIKFHELYICVLNKLCEV